LFFGITLAVVFSLVFLPFMFADLVFFVIFFCCFLVYTHTRKILDGEIRVVESFVDDQDDEYSKDDKNNPIVWETPAKQGSWAAILGSLSSATLAHGCITEDDTGLFVFAAIVPTIVFSLSTLVLPGTCLAWFVYEGHSKDDAIALIKAMYRHHFDATMHPSATELPPFDLIHPDTSLDTFSQAWSLLRSNDWSEPEAYLQHADNFRVLASIGSMLRLALSLITAAGARPICDHFFAPNIPTYAAAGGADWQVQETLGPYVEQGGGGVDTITVIRPGRKVQAKTARWHAAQVVEVYDDDTYLVQFEDDGSWHKPSGEKRTVAAEKSLAGTTRRMPRTRISTSVVAGLVKTRPSGSGSLLSPSQAAAVPVDSGSLL
jgi:hypothetical protein